MDMLVMAAMLTVSVGEGQGKGGGLKGTWLIVYAEEGGRKNNSWEQRQATVKGNTLSFEGEGGKKRSLDLKLGKGQTVEATSDGGGKGGTWKGVYILGQEYLCISLTKGGKMKAGGGAAGGAPGGGAGVGGGMQSGSSGDFILILRRQRGKAPVPPPQP